MTFGLYQDELAVAREGGVGFQRPDPGIWAGTASLTMQGFAKTVRAIDLMAAAPAIGYAQLTGNYDAIDRHFAGDENTLRGLATRAVEYWTPEPGTVGVAGRIVGGLLPKIAEVVLSPALAIGSETFNQGEDLIREGVDAKKALAVGLTQGTGLGVGIWAPIFGNTLLTRALVAGAGVNVAQGVATRAISQQILKGEKAAEQFNPWEREGIALDLLLGIVFGGLYHAGARGRDAREALSQTDRDALLVANQARHLEDTTLPGRPADATSLAAHVQAVKQAADDLLAGRQPNVDQIVQDARFAPDVARDALATEIRESVAAQARQTVLDTIAAEQTRVKAEETPGFLRTADDLVALKPQEARELAPELQRAVEIARKPAFQRTAEERVFLKSALEGDAFAALTKPIEPLVRNPQPVEPARAPAQDAEPKAEAAAHPDPLLTEARQRVAEHGDVMVTDETGRARPLRELMDEASKGVEQARADAKLFETAAACMIGGL